MKRNQPAVRAIVAVAVVLALTAGSAAMAGAAAQATPPAGHWGSAHQVGGLNALNTGRVAVASSVSCGAPGNCVAVGTYRTADFNEHAFRAEEKAGVWGPRAPVTTAAAAESVMDSLSCTDAGDCVATGHMISSHAAAFVSNEVHGTWGDPVPLAASGVNTEARSVSCPPGPAAPGNCTAGGWFTDSSNMAQAFTADEKNGTWGPEQQVMGLQGISDGTDIEVSSVSCASPGNCAAVGHLRRAGDRNLQPFIADRSGGTWSDGHPVPGLSMITTSSAEADAVSCAVASSGDCALGGAYTDGHGHQQAFVADEVKGDWSVPQPVRGLAKLNVGGFAEVTGISCGAPGSCVVSGTYAPDTSHFTAGFVAEEKGGTWQAARPVVGVPNSSTGTRNGTARAVACPSAGNCVVGGSISVGFGDLQAATLSEVNGRWGTPKVVPGMTPLSSLISASVESVSCASVGNCAVGGFYTDKQGSLQAFIADQSTASATALKLSAAKIKFGHEQAEKLTVSVRGRTGGTPGGQVTIVAGPTRLCVITLRAAAGTCKLGPKKLRPGSYHLTARYGGSPTYASSRSAARTLTVTR
jgi:hypothetical protein